jgi:hypothetical protein
MATFAVFIALGGTAWALANDSVKSKHIVDGQVKSPDVKNDGLGFADIDEPNLSSTELPVAGALVSQGQDLGVSGETKFIAPTGSALASATIEPVLVGGPASGLRLSELFVWLPGTLGGRPVADVHPHAEAIAQQSG